MRRVLPLGALLGLLALPATAAASTGIALEYAVRYGLLEIVMLRTTARVEDGRYEATSELRTVGVAGMLFPWTATARSAGWREAAGLRPLWHRSRGVYRSRERTVAIDYGSAAPRTVVHPPPEDDHRLPVAAADQLQTIDPITASLAPLLGDCAGALRVFDGRRRYDLLLTDHGVSELPAPTPVFRGAGRHCRARVTPLGGFWRPDEQHDERPAQLDLWLAAPAPAPFAVPVYMELSGPRGTLRIALRTIETQP